MNWAEMHTDFIQAMVQTMYGFEAKLVNRPDSPTNAEMQEFYESYCYL